MTILYRKIFLWWDICKFEIEDVYLTKTYVGFASYLAKVLQPVWCRGGVKGLRHPVPGGHPKSEITKIEML